MACMGNACVAAGWPLLSPSIHELGASHELASEAHVRQALGRVDLGSPLNNPELHPVSAYTPTERLLARLEALTLVAPLCKPQHEAMYRRAQALL